MPYGSFGDVVFEVVEYFEHTEENPYIYARKDTIFPPSTTQWMGKELRKLKMSIKLHHMLSQPEQTYQQLKDLAEKGEAQKLIIAEKVLGDFVIDKIDAQYTQVSLQGVPIAISLSLELTEYVKKELQTKKIQTKKASKKPAATKNPQIAERKVVTKTNPDGYTYRRIE